MVNFHTWIPDRAPTLLLFWIDLFLPTLVFVLQCCPPLGNSDHVFVSASIGFSSQLKKDASFHHITYDCSCVDGEGLHDHMRDVPGDNIFKLMLLLLLVNFVSGFSLELMYIALIVSVRSSFTHHHGFQLLVLLPQSIEITFFVFSNRLTFLSLK